MESRGDEVFDLVTEGKTLREISQAMETSRTMLLKWVNDPKFPDRQEKYRIARSDGTHASVEEAREILDRVDPSNSAAVLKAKHQAQFRQWYAGVMNRKEFGTEQGVQVNIGTLHLEALRAVGGPPPLPAPIKFLPDAIEAEIVE